MGKSYISSSLTFYDDKIVVEDSDSRQNGVEVMMDWEHTIMSASAAYVTQNGGDILEIGFGMGISAGYMHSHSISSHTIIENHPQIIPKAVEWTNGKSNVIIVSQSWYDALDSLGTYDGIFHDTFDDTDIEQFSSSLSSLTKSGTKLTMFWGEDNDTSSIPPLTTPNIKSFQLINIEPDSNSYYSSGSKIYYLPKMEF